MPSSITRTQAQKNTQHHAATNAHTDDWLLALVLIVINFTVPGVRVKALQRHYTDGDPALSYPSVHVPLSGVLSCACLWCCASKYVLL